MSSESDEYRKPRTRRQSSTPDTPRKRPRLSLTDSSRRRSQKELLRDDTEETYNDDYRLLFNDHVNRAASRFAVDDTVRHYSEQIGSSVWSNKELTVFFAALERLGRNNAPGIASAIGTKSEGETRDFLQSLQDAAVQRGDTKLTLRDISAAIEFGNECDQQLEQAADALAWFQERFEARQEQERYGDYWLITPQIAENIDDALNGVVRPRSASASQRPQSRSSWSGVALSCIACKKRKRRCDRKTPCGNCTRRKDECVYPEDAFDVEDSKHTSDDISGPISASVSQTSLLGRLGNAFAGSCIACKTRKQKCDRGAPCSRCASLKIECEYPALGGSGFAGACERCKKRKKKCDRKTPCTNCANFQAQCAYSSTPIKAFGPSPAPEQEQEILQDNDESMFDHGEVPILQMFPEASLIRPKTMLKLSRDLFMNRCPEFPSPWPHWSEYTSELAAEPSMYRTAFGDFHRLVVSVTKRLVKTTLTQATSRLRAQRVRTKRNVTPLIKKRDAYAAIDVLGMKRDGNERWKHLSRRCGLKVLNSTITPRGKRHTVVPWEEVERIMSSIVASSEPVTTDAEIFAEPENFKSRAARSGTPLPMEDLTLSDSEDLVEPEALSNDNHSTVEPFNDKERRSMHHGTIRPRNSTGRYMSVAPGEEMEEAQQHLRTLEDFDQEASHQEQHTLWNMLGLRPPENDDVKADEDEPQDVDNEKLTTIRDDWRDTLQYREPWETFGKPVPTAKFSANQKPLSPMPTTHDRQSQSSTSPSVSTSDDSSTSGPRRRRRRSPAAVELRARGATAYAALQEEDLGGSDREGTNSSSDKADEDEEVPEKDIPTQSIESEHAISDDEIMYR